ncbi:rna methylase hua enhancer 1 [Moniliophthora roreri MCA 2997]|uniref:Small RNA 2'-O-methyltransferase n=2 Tax=Moniliophthora roreri TaxID=221103 RepID=V2XJP8_MONRO|nr:rna methylase hua enhancer 1 [Moniliophthora roreri MCA 2997]KAI3607865.1 rna methylase hua enhancer 1 [Moniliophthora roreri]
MDVNVEELKVTFIPQLYLQRRIWILDILRKECVTNVLDVGCGEGQLLSALCQPAPWLSPPPPSVIPEDSFIPPMNLFNNPLDPIANLHPTVISGLDISSLDLKFAAQVTEPPKEDESELQGEWARSRAAVRWEELTANIWKGGLEIVNDEFIGMECIVATEVIEHLPPEIFAFFAPVLLGIYSPRLLLLTTPSYTFNARFTSPDTRRTGFPDPTGRTDRVFRHDDHKFEWTIEEFKEYCGREAKEWGYEVEFGDIGRPIEMDPFDRDAELGGASQVAVFRRLNGDREGIEARAREVVRVLSSQTAGSLEEQRHELVVSHNHPAHPKSQDPASVEEIGALVRERMENYRESFMRLEDLWFERDIGIACGGWIEVFINAVHQYDGLSLKRDGGGSNGEDILSPGANENIQKQRELWKVELVGGVSLPNTRMLWPTTEVDLENERSIEYMPADWNPEEEYKSEYDYAGSGTSSGGEETSTGGEGDVSWNEDEDDARESWGEWKNAVNHRTNSGSWGDVNAEETGGWDEELDKRRVNRLPSSASSTTGWDGDESDGTTS